MDYYEEKTLRIFPTSLRTLLNTGRNFSTIMPRRLRPGRSPNVKKR
jgi:hypothetical protein